MVKTECLKSGWASEGEFIPIIDWFKSGVSYSRICLEQQA